MKRRDFLSIPALGAVAGCAVDEVLDPAGPSVFLHGVASGDPLHDRVILWTRAEGDGEPSVEVSWTIARDEALSDVVQSGSTLAEAERGYTLKLDVTGLEPATTYHYRFSALGEASPIGRTRTAPAGEAARLRIGVCSCSNYAYGYFAAYGHLAASDLDLVVHLGDYIYEYGDGEYGGVRFYDPPHEIVTLDDYRRRYAHYRTDPDLQELHRRHPMVAVWDDHETADNSWTDGAVNHSASEGAWADRLAAGRQAYLEWLPIREEPSASPPVGPGQRIFRKLSFGDLADLIMLDTRIWGRDMQLSDDDPAFDDTERTLLGADQEAWLAAQLVESRARWKLIGQQVVFTTVPQYFNIDAWDGYPATRERVFDVIEQENIGDVVILTGDIHSSWAADLPRDPFSADYDPQTGSGSLGVELVVPGITSPGLPPELAEVAMGFVLDNPHLKYAELVSNGYLVLDIDRDRIEATYHYLDSVASRDEPVRDGGVLLCQAGSRHLTPG